MASRFMCEHEKWAKQRYGKGEEALNTLRTLLRNGPEPMTMGVTPDCPWCLREGARKVAEKIKLRMARQEGAKMALELLAESSKSYGLDPIDKKDFEDELQRKLDADPA